ncbi:MAG: MbnP family copper-binding protein [Cyanobacteria bacterium P01_G01_bin.54]
MLRSPLLLLTPALLTVATTGPVAAQTPTQDITLQFQAQVGETPFTCGSTYSDLGRQNNTIAVTDFRFYISDVVLLTADGTAVPITLSQDGQWQYENVALLDFEDKTAACANGTAETNTQVVGTVPVGDYQGLAFTLGIPFDLNHEDATLAPSPLNLTSMWWNWRGGYKFLRVDLAVADGMAMPEAATPEPHHPEGSGHHHSHGSGDKSGDHHHHHGGTEEGQGEPQQHESGDHGHGGHGHDGHGGHDHGGHGEQTGAGFLIHLGSTGCQMTGESQQPTHCHNPNRVAIAFPEFDPSHQVVIADLAALVAGNDLSLNAANTPPGCMSSPEDTDCEPLFEQLGILGDPKFFRVGHLGDHQGEHQGHSAHP